MLYGEIAKVDAKDSRIPDRYVRILYRYKPDKWYAVRVEKQQHTQTLDPKQVFILEPEFLK